MKICFLAHANSIHTRRWAEYFHHQGHEVHVISLTPLETPMPGVIVHVIPHAFKIKYEKSNWHYLLQLPAIWRLIRQIKPDILNAHFLSSYGFLGALTKPAKLPFVISLHGSDILIIPRRSVVHRWIAIFALRRAHLITSVANHMTREIFRYVTSDKQVLTAQYGINLRIFHLPASSKRDAICLSTRAMVPISNLDTLINAAKIIDERGADLNFCLAGQGELFAHLSQRVKALGLESRVKFIGLVPPEHIPGLMQQASIYVSLSSSDGTSLALLEALATGVFPVVADIPANQEWIEDGVNGFLVSPTDAQNLADKLMTAWQEPSLRSSAASYNWKIVQERADYDKNMYLIEQAFLKLIEDR